MTFSDFATIAIAVTISIAASVPVSAQGVCDLTRSASACLSESSRGAKQAAKAAAEKAGTQAVTEQTAAKPTGNAAAVSGSESAIKDFLPRFATALAIPGLSSLPKALGFSFNTPANDPVWRLPFALKVEGVANEPTLSEALANAIPLALRPTIKDSVTKTLAEFGDLKFSLALNAENRTWGRSIASNKDTIDAIIGEMFAGDLAKLVDVQTVLAGDEIDNMTPLNATCGDGPRPMMPLNCFNEVDRQKLIDAVLSVSQAFNDFSDLAKKKLKTSHLDRLSDLVNAQRQFSVSSEARMRDRLVGDNAQKLAVRYEWSPVNLNSARDYCHGTLGYVCLRQYLAQDGIVRALDAGHRFWFTADLSNVAAYDFALLADSARVVKPRALAIEPAFGYGSYLGVADQTVRVDWELRYRRSDNQFVREDRVTSSLALTQKVNDQSNAVLTIRWANKPEFRGDVDKAWRANLGYSYKISDIGK